MTYQILLVDDDRAFCEEFQDCFSDEFIIHIAENGKAALTCLAMPNEYDLVILDVRLPDISGTTLLTRLKAQNPKLIIIIITGFSSKNIVIDALKGKADDFIEKPFDIQKTRELLNRLLHEKAEGYFSATSSPKECIEHVRQFVLRNVTKKLTLTDAAKCVCLSSKYLSRLFLEHTGMTFSQFRIEAKVTYAKQLLIDKPGMTVDQLSNDLGYENLESFCRMFKRIVGVTPTNYRKHHK